MPFIRKKKTTPLRTAIQIVILSILLSIILAMLITKIFDLYVPLEPATPILIAQEISLQPTYAVRPVPSSFTEIVRGDTSKKQVIFTFDGGSGEGSTKEILEALAKHKVKSTFFLVGKWVEENPEWTRRIVAEGHEIFNHSYSHPYFTQISTEQIQLELQKMDDVLYATAGVRTQPYFRPPYGDRDAASNLAAAEAGYRSIYWSVDSLDWREGETPESIKGRVLPNIHNGAIVLMHVGNPVTGLVIDEIFTTLENQGYKMVSLTEGL